MDDLQTLVQAAPMDLITQLLAGGMGGNVAGVALRNFSLGPVWNSLAGLFGGALGAHALFGLGVMYPDGKAGALGSQLIAGGMGGASLIILLGLIRSMSVR